MSGRAAMGFARGISAGLGFRRFDLGRGVRVPPGGGGGREGWDALLHDWSWGLLLVRVVLRLCLG